MTVSDIVRKICSEHGLPRRTSAAAGQHEIVLQHNETDWDFIWRLAQRIGFEFIVDDTKAIFEPPSASRAGRARLSGRPARLPAPHHRGAAGADGQRARVRLQGQAGGRRHRDRAGADHGGRDHPQPGGDKFPGAVIEIGGQSFASQGEADAMAQATLDQLANAYLAAEGECDGNPQIKAGTTLKITGVGTQVLGHLPRRQGGPRAARPAATSPSSPTPPASTPCSASPAAPTAARGGSTRSSSAS